MLRTLTRLMLVLSLALPVVFAADDDRIMGIWEGKITTAGWESRTVKAKIWGVRGNAWEGQFQIIENGGPIAEGSISGKREGSPETVKSVPFSGSLNLEGDYFLTATTAEEKMTGQLTPGRETKKGTVKASKKGGEPITFELQRQHIKPPTLGATPPAGAIALVGPGADPEAWKLSPGATDRTAEGGLPIIQPSWISKQEFGSCKLHVEFITPYMPNEGVGSQERGNSGVYVQGRYEIQVLDSFGAAPRNNLCGGIYKIAVPLADAVLPPLTVQTYDIEFHAPKFDASGKKTQDAELTVLHNGIVIHDKLKLPNATPGGVTDVEGPAGPLLLQNHHNNVEYRNIWIQPIQD